MNTNKQQQPQPASKVTPKLPDDGIFVEYRGYSVEITVESSGILRLTVGRYEEDEKADLPADLELRVTRNLQLNWT